VKILKDSQNVEIEIGYGFVEKIEKLWNRINLREKGVVIC